MSGYKPLPEGSYPTVADQAMWEIFGTITESCPHCGTKFARQVMERHIVHCEIATHFDDDLIKELQGGKHPVFSFIQRDISTHAAWHLFSSNGIFHNEKNPEMARYFDAEEAKAYNEWERRLGVA